MDISEQGRRRTVLMEEESKRSFLDHVTRGKGETIRLKKEQGIPDDTCICGRKIEPERLQLNLPTCRECAFSGKFCVLRK